MPSEISQSGDIDSAQLLDEDLGRCPFDIDLGSERSLPGARGCGGYEDNGPGK
jgi:hypothetical protein